MQVAFASVNLGSNLKPSLVKKSTGRFRVPDEEIHEHLARRGDRHWLPPAGLCPIDAPRRRNSSVALEAERDRTVRPAAGAGAPSAGSASRCLDRDPPASSRQASRVEPFSRAMPNTSRPAGSSTGSSTLGAQLLESDAPLHARRGLIQLPSGGRRRARTGGLRCQLPASRRTEEQVRSEQLLPLEPEHPARRVDRTFMAVRGRARRRAASAKKPPLPNYREAARGRRGGRRRRARYCTLM